MRRPRTSLISVDGWNAFVDAYFRGRVVSITSIEPIPWRHPWWSDIRWDSIGERWTAEITPGFCLSASGNDPLVSVPGVLAAVGTMERLGIERPTSATVDAYLSELPRVPISVTQWRPIGTDAVEVTGSIGESVPQQFLDRGVVGPVVLDTSGQNGAVTRLSGFVQDRNAARLLRACDLVLTHDRPRTVIGPSLGDGVLDVDFSLLSNGVRRAGPWVEIVRKYEPAEPGGIADQIFGAAGDTGRDVRHLATIYLLSQPGQEPGSEPDETWAPTVVYHTEWNQQYRVRFQEVTVESTRITIAVPQLGGGALGARAQPIVDEINQRTAELEAALARVENFGIFSLA
jgi:hypothetical protein